MYKPKYVMFILFVLIWMAGCSQSSSSNPPETPSNSPANHQTGTNNTESPKESPKDPLTEIIEGAKKEGAATIVLSSQLEGEGVKRLGEEIKQKFGVDLDIKFQPGGSYPKNLSDAIAENKAGLPPTFDLMQFSEKTLYQAINAGLVQQVDWKPLLLPGTPEEAIQLDGQALSLYTAHAGLMYNPNDISAEELPKKLSDLADPKWKGKFALPSYMSNYMVFAIFRGEHETLFSELPEIMKNEPLIGTYSQNFSRFSSGEYPMQFTLSNYYNNAKNSGIPVAWASLEASQLQIHSTMVTKGARNPNAAQLIALYLASPDGHKLMVESANSGSILYPGNFEHDIHKTDTDAGLKIFNPMEFKGALDFFVSEEGENIEKELGKIVLGK